MCDSDIKNAGAHRYVVSTCISIKHIYNPYTADLLRYDDGTATGKEAESCRQLL